VRTRRVQIARRCRLRPWLPDTRRLLESASMRKSSR
jgi:hypothetical protein